MVSFDMFLFNHVFNSTWGTNYNLNVAIFKSLFVSPNICSSYTAPRGNFHKLAEAEINFVDLLCQLSSWSQNNGLATSGGRIDGLFKSCKMGCGASAENTDVKPLEPKPAASILPPNKQPGEDSKLKKNTQTNPINRNMKQSRKLTNSTTKLLQSKSPTKKQTDKRTSTKSLPKQDKTKGMGTTKTTSLSQQQSLKKNGQTSPSKVKLDIQQVVSETNNKMMLDQKITKTPSKKKKSNKKNTEENKVAKMSDLMKIYGL